VATTLLAIDDSVTMRKVLEMTFAGEDYRVVTAESAEAALAKLRAERPSIVLCDVTLDGAGGYGLCAKIKAENPTVAVVILASKQQPYDAPKGQSARADDYIEKPFDTQQLIEKIKRLAGRPLAEAQPPQTAPAARPPGPGATTQPGVPTFGAPISARPAGTAPVGAPAVAAPAPPPAPPPPPRAPTPPAGMPLNTRPTASGMGPGGPSPQQPIGRGTLAYGPPGGSTPMPGPVAAAPPARAPMPPAPPPPPAVAPHAAPAPQAATHAAPVAAVAAVASATNGQLAAKLAHMGLTDAQVSAVLALSREVVEKVVWEVVPVLAETMIREEIKRLTSE
jgi:CheY-like chemotaxis protein